MRFITLTRENGQPVAVSVPQIQKIEPGKDHTAIILTTAYVAVTETLEEILERINYDPFGSATDALNDPNHPGWNRLKQAVTKTEGLTWEEANEAMRRGEKVTNAEWCQDAYIEFDRLGGIENILDEEGKRFNPSQYIETSENKWQIYRESGDQA
jgi:uncharacterized protein YlzI (FlbEa/FlbD family)